MTDKTHEDSQGRLVRDISGEAFRTYVFSNGTSLEIQSPLTLTITRTGGQRITSKSGLTYCVPEYLYIKWSESND